MTVRAIKLENLAAYYNSRASQVEKDHRVHLLKVSPYDTQESINWAIKHLALPIVGILILLFTLPFAFLFIGNRTFKILIIILSLVAAFFIINYVIVLIAKKKYKIKKEDGLVTKKSFFLNKNLLLPESQEHPHFWIGFVGDIMMMRNHDLQFDQEVKKFFDKVDVIVGNLEGILSIQPGPVSKQGHPDEILTQLTRIFNDSNKETQWLLCLSNNHSNDFGWANFDYSLKKVQFADRINAFGRIDSPNILLKKDILIASASQWSNQKNWDYISRFDKKTNSPPDTHNKYSYFGRDKFNILYPHWGYENETYVRTLIKKVAKSLLTGEKKKFSWIKSGVRKWFKKPKFLAGSDDKWDLVFGHHSHVRQPIMKIPDEITLPTGAKFKINKLVAFSGGNFTSGVRIIRKKKHIHGIIMKCQIGRFARDSSKYIVNKVEWERTINRRTKKPPTKTIYIDEKKERGYNRLYFIIMILLLVVIFILIVIQFFLP